MKVKLKAVRLAAPAIAAGVLLIAPHALAASEVSAPEVVLASTHAKALEVVTIEQLREYTAV